MARAWGVEVIERPPQLATDEATSLSVWQHALPEIPADILVNLYPTSPVRDTGLVDRVVESYLTSLPTCLATGFICKCLPFGDTDDGLSDLHGCQQIEGFFYDDGNVYVVNAEIVLSGEQYGTRLGHYQNERECSVEIDDAFDLWLAEQVLLKRLAEGKT